MIYTMDELRERITPVAKKYHLKAAYIFGSYARGEAKENSDVDILVDRTGSNIQGMFGIGGLYNDLSESIGKKSILLRHSRWNRKAPRSAYQHLLMP